MHTYTVVYKAPHKGKKQRAQLKIVKTALSTMEASEAAQHTMGERRPYGEFYYKNEMSTI